MCVDSAEFLDDLSRLGRRQRVVIELGNGEQVAEFLGISRLSKPVQGQLLRLTSPQDELRYGYLKKFAQSALNRWNESVCIEGDENRIIACEPVLDGVTILCQFLTPLEGASTIFEKISALYFEEAMGSDFVRKVAEGCGPNCGTAEVTGCGNCSSCQLKPCVKPQR